MALSTRRHCGHGVKFGPCEPCKVQRERKEGREDKEGEGKRKRSKILDDVSKGYPSYLTL